MSAKELSLESFPTLPELILTVLDATGEELTAQEIATQCEGLWVQSLLWPINCHPDTKPTVAGLKTVDAESVDQTLYRMIKGLAKTSEPRAIAYSEDLNGALKVSTLRGDSRLARQKLDGWVEMLRQLAPTDHQPD